MILPKRDPTFFPLGEIPFYTYCKVLEELPSACYVFVPSTMVEDLAIGSLNRLLYWYPVYVDKLYEMAEEGIDYKEYLDRFNSLNSFQFSILFEPTVKKLDKLIENKLKIKSNHLNEMIVKLNN